jgi:hypothetical protein
MESDPEWESGQGKNSASDYERHGEVNIRDTHIEMKIVITLDNLVSWLKARTHCL